MTLSLYPAHLGQRAYGHCRWFLSRVQAMSSRNWAGRAIHSLSQLQLVATVPHNELVVTYFTFVMQMGRHQWHWFDSSGQSKLPQVSSHLFVFGYWEIALWMWMWMPWCVHSSLTYIYWHVDSLHHHTHHHLTLLATLHYLVSRYQLWILSRRCYKSKSTVFVFCSL